VERKAFDHTIDFEDTDGDCEVEESSNGAIDQLNAAAAAHGKYGVKLTFDGSGLDLFVAGNGGSDVSEIYLRFYIYVDSNIAGLDANALYVIAGVYNAGFTGSVLLLVFTDGDGLPVYWYWSDEGGLAAFDTAHLVAFDTWVMLEMHELSAGSGVLEGRVDKANFDNQGAGDNSAGPDIGGGHIMGWQNSGQTLIPANGEFLYYDDYVTKEGSGDWIGEYAIPWDRRNM